MWRGEAQALEAFFVKLVEFVEKLNERRGVFSGVFGVDFRVIEELCFAVDRRETI